MTGRDVTDTLALALEVARLNETSPRYRPRRLREHGPCDIGSQLGEWFRESDMAYTRGTLYHPMTHGKIERYHRSMNNQILLENYYLPGKLEARLNAFVDY
jgi:hypothetical protein